MPTNFYLLNEAAPYTPASWRGSWDVEGTSTLAMDPHKFGSTSNAASQSETSATTPFRVAVARFVSRKLAAQTISGTVDMVVGVSEANVDADYYTRLHIFVEKTDGTLLGTALSGYEESSGGGGTEWPTTNTGRALQSAQSLTSVVVPSDANDYRLVVEIGVRAENVHTTARSAVVRYGARTSLHAPLADLTAGSTSTTTLAGFLTFSGTISLHAEVLPNLTPETATALSAPPTTVTQTVRQGGYTYTVWYKRTPTVTGVEGVFPFGDLSVYRPTTTVYQGPIGSFLSVTSKQNRPLQPYLESGITYYYRVVTNASTASPAVLTLDVDPAPQWATVSVGSALIVDDTAGFPAVVVSRATGEVLRFVAPIVAGEAGDTLTDGTLAVEDESGETVRLYASGTFTQIASVAVKTTTNFGSIRANRTLNQFFAASKTPNPDQVVRISAAGAILNTYTITGVNDLSSLSVNNAGTVLYYSRGAGDTAAINRWDLPGATGLSQLVNLGTTTTITDIHTLADDTVLALWANLSGSVTARRYNSGGTLLNTYAFSPDATLDFPVSTLPRIAVDADDPTSFLLWTHHTGRVSRLRTVRVSDGTVMATVDVAEFEQGASEQAESATPERFGVSFSCPLIVLRSGADVTLPILCCPCDCPPEIVNGKPVPTTHTGPMLPPVVPLDWTPQCAGGGDVPSAADATDAESWVQ